jgi:hypothetical protein
MSYFYPVFDSIYGMCTWQHILARAFVDDAIDSSVLRRDFVRVHNSWFEVENDETLCS